MLGLGLGVNKPVFLNAGGVDPDAQAFIDAVIAAGGSLSEDQMVGIDRYVKNLKGEGDINNSFDFWSLIVQSHPFVGGTAAAHLIELKTATSVGTFFGGWTHNANGALGNATNAYMNTTLIADNSLPNQSQAAWCMVGNNFTGGTKEIMWGGTNPAGSSGLGLFLNYSFGLNFGYGVSSARISGIAAVANTVGFYCVRRTTSDNYADINGANYNTTAANVYTANGFAVALNARNRAGTIDDFCDGLIQNLGFSTYFNQTNSGVLSSINSAFQSDMGR